MLALELVLDCARAPTVHPPLSYSPSLILFDPVLFRLLSFLPSSLPSSIPLFPARNVYSFFHASWIFVGERRALTERALLDDAPYSLSPPAGANRVRNEGGVAGGGDIRNNPLGVAAAAAFSSSSARWRQGQGQGQGRAAPSSSEMVFSSPDREGGGSRGSGMKNAHRRRTSAERYNDGAGSGHGVKKFSGSGGGDGAAWNRSSSGSRGDQPYSDGGGRGRASGHGGMHYSAAAGGGQSAIKSPNGNLDSASG